MDLKQTWLELRDALQHICDSAYAATIIAPVVHQSGIDNQIVVFKRQVAVAQAPVTLTTQGQSAGPMHVDDSDSSDESVPNWASLSGDNSFSEQVFVWDAGPEYEWLTKEYRIRMILKRGLSEPKHWEATISTRLILDKPKTPHDPNDFLYSPIPFELSFSPVTYGGIPSGPYDTKSMLSFFNCHAGGLGCDITYKFCGAKGTRKRSSTCSGNCSSIYRAIKTAIADRTVPAVCTLRAQTTSNCAYLAMKVSLAKARLLALPANATPFGLTDVIRVICRDRCFDVNLGPLTAASSVIATCFGRGNFKESKTLEFNMAAFSKESVEAFLHFCLNGTVPQGTEAVVVELAELSHQYEVNGLLLICEICLIHDLVYCSSIQRLCSLARVAMKLDLPLLLAAFDIILVERHHFWIQREYSPNSPSNLKPWADVVEELVGFESARFRSLASLMRGLELKEDCTVIPPNL